MGKKKQDQNGTFIQSGINNRQTIYGNHVGISHGTVTQVGHGSSMVVMGGPNNTVNINGKSYTGRKIEQRNGRIFVDDRDVTDEVGVGIEHRAFNITIQGTVERIENCDQVTVNGNASKVKTVSGAIEITGDVTGDVESVSGSIHCGKVAGKVKTVSGDIKTK
ncbi:MAG: hypothetical protein EOO63_04845 [Hymenobacter sp.]|nr:MAG: hypothetical protein EOO63_04845 [Hymenobacter sp.]